jgi:hypothetical protein
MWKKLAAALAVAALMTSATPAEAKDMSGKFGVGLNQSLTSGITGLGLNYWIGNLKLGGLLGMDFFFPDSGDSEYTIGLGIQALYAIARAEDVNLNFGLRVNLGIADPGAADTTVGVQFDIPLEAEYFLSDHFSFFGHVGLTLTIIGEDGNPLAPGSGQGVGFGVGRGGFSGGVGFNFYF